MCEEKNLLGFILGDFITNASGHPGSEAAAKRRNRRKTIEQI
jgi:hypothetical protein